MSAAETHRERPYCPQCGGKLAMLLFLGVQPEGLSCLSCKVLWPLPSTEAKVVKGPALGRLYSGREADHG